MALEQEKDLIETAYEQIYDSAMLWDIHNYHPSDSLVKKATEGFRKIDIENLIKTFEKKIREIYDEYYLSCSPVIGYQDNQSPSFIETDAKARKHELVIKNLREYLRE